MGVYPRVYGESISRVVTPPRMGGLSPRVRGIPLSAIADLGTDGLSPRVRGIRYRRAALLGGRGSIPACTGNPTTANRSCGRLRVYPRVYGESFRSAFASQRKTGLSPRVRGIRGDVLQRPVRFGSIPACTGNPRSCVYLLCVPRVYPRVYGESVTNIVKNSLVRGLSPRVRGILRLEGHRRRANGSIPACTGNPCRLVLALGDCWVYPRVYGESIENLTEWYDDGGLSPRVRGIHLQASHPTQPYRSIPACTGNPALQGITTLTIRVYPRVYGESARKAGTGATKPGLSPRVRGIQDPRLLTRQLAGSIPACTGNPADASSPGAARRVYPRVYGESSAFTSVMIFDSGLSPRVRGIQ